MKWRISSPPRESRTRAVGQVAEVLLAADRHAEVGARVDAVDALAALRREEGDDVVAGRDRGDPVADLLDHPGALVAEHGRRVARRIGARGRVQVGVADPAGFEPHQHLARARLGQVDLLDRQRLPELLEHGGADLHLSSSSSSTSVEPILASYVRSDKRLGNPSSAGRRVLSTWGTAADMQLMPSSPPPMPLPAPSPSCCWRRSPRWRAARLRRPAKPGRATRPARASRRRSSPTRRRSPAPRPPT